MSLIAFEARRLVKQVQEIQRNKDVAGIHKDEELDRISKPLIITLMNEGKITRDEAKRAFVEPQGIWEFGLVPICVDGANNGWVQVHQDGLVERF
jgi:hypothetical protein